MPNPYELRLDVLKIARDLVTDEYHMKRENILEKWRTQCANAERDGSSSPMPPDLPSFPTEDDVIRKATKLNEFVSTSPQLK